MNDFIAGEDEDIGGDEGDGTNSVTGSPRLKPKMKKPQQASSAQDARDLAAIRQARKEMMARQDQSMHAALDQQREMDEQQRIQRMLAERYGPENENEEDDEDRYGEERAHQPVVNSISVLPSVKDPKLFLVKCDPGKEDESVWLLMKRYLSKQSSKEEKLFITSVFTTPASKGYIYIEAFRGKLRQH